MTATNMCSNFGGKWCSPPSPTPVIWAWKRLSVKGWEARVSTVSGSLKWVWAPSHWAPGILARWLCPPLQFCFRHLCRVISITSHCSKHCNSHFFQFTECWNSNLGDIPCHTSSHMWLLVDSDPKTLFDTRITYCCWIHLLFSILLWQLLLVEQIFVVSSIWREDFETSLFIFLLCGSWLG